MMETYYRHGKKHPIMMIKLNKLIWLNNGDGTFINYELNDIVFEGPTPFFLHPYMDNGILHFLEFFRRMNL